MSDSFGCPSPEIFIGPSNMAGQAYQWANSINSVNLGKAASFSFRQEGSSNFRIHETSLDVQELVNSSEGLSIVLEGGLWIDGSKPDLSEWAEILDGLAKRNHQVRFVLHGSDIRDPYHHAEVHSQSIFKSLSDERRRELSRRASYTRGVIENFGIDCCYTTVDLAKYSPPDATWLPLVLGREEEVEGDFGTSSSSYQMGDAPVIYHNPSSMDLKGSNEISEVIQNLSSMGKARLYPESGPVPHRINLNRIRASDVIVDQVGVGGLGLTALEAINLGTIVVSDVGPEAEEIYADSIDEGLLVPVHPEAGLQSAVVKALQLAVTKNQDSPDERSIKQIRSLHSGSLSTQRLEALCSGEYV